MDDARERLRERDRKAAVPAPVPPKKSRFAWLTYVGLAVMAFVTGIGISYVLVVQLGVQLFTLSPTDTQDVVETSRVEASTAGDSSSFRYAESVREDTLGIYPYSRNGSVDEWLVVTLSGDAVLVNGLDESEETLDMSNPVIQAVVNEVINSSQE